MEWYRVRDGWRLSGGEYDALVHTEGTWPCVEISYDARKIARLPLVSAVNTKDGKEVLSDPVVNVQQDGSITVSASSSVWSEHTYRWIFEDRSIRMSQSVKGSGYLERCYFCSTGESDMFAFGDSAGFSTNVQLYTDGYFSPAVNLGNRTEFDTGEPGTVGLTKGEFAIDGHFLPDKSNDLFVPPLSYVFHTDRACMGISIGTNPGSYRFNEFCYTGVLYAGGAFYVDYLGYTDVNKLSSLPELFIQFGHDPYDVIRDFVSAIDKAGYGTQFSGSSVPWHSQPIFCGWSAQTSAASLVHMHARDFCTQSNYEKWIDILECHGVDYGTVIIDDKWQKGYGTFQVDEEKWPDMKGFIKKLHNKGKHVLLWAPVLFTDGLPEEWCIAEPVSKKSIADLANKDYRKMLTEQIQYLVGELDVDGFKEDLIGCGLTEKGLPNYGTYHGIEMLAEFQRLLYSTTHEIKPDALVETQTPNPLFRCSSDMLRLNDVWYGAHNLPEIMRHRARIARIAGWRIIDCDDGGASGIEEWRRYLNIQPDLGVPALYFVAETEATHEKLTEEDWHTLAYKWNAYRSSHDRID